MVLDDKLCLLAVSVACMHVAGFLDHGEVCSLVQSIPDITREEQKYIIGMDRMHRGYEYDIDEVVKKAAEHACGIMTTFTEPPKINKAEPAFIQVTSTNPIKMVMVR